MSRSTTDKRQNPIEPTCIPHCGGQRSSVGGVGGLPRPLSTSDSYADADAAPADPVKHAHADTCRHSRLHVPAANAGDDGDTNRVGPADADCLSETHRDTNA